MAHGQPTALDTLDLIFDSTLISREMEKINYEVMI
jgi:hypothetical protein